MRRSRERWGNPRAPVPLAPGSLPVAVAHDYRAVHPHERTDVAVDFPVGAQNLDRLPARAERYGHLAHARILGAHIGVDGAEQLDLRFESRLGKRIFLPGEGPGA